MTKYNSEKPYGGRVVGTTVTASATTFYDGQLLERPALVYIPWAGVNPILAVAWEDKVLTAEGSLAVATTGSEVDKAGIVDASGDPLTITTAIIENCRNGGIVLQ